MTQSERTPWSLIRRYDRPVPRYTSYPTVPVWEDAGPQQAHAALHRAAVGTRAMSVYVHLPFCERMCTYCGCNMIGATRARDMERYAEALDAELALLRTYWEGRPLVQLHLGGGTPTTYSPQALHRLVTRISSAFPRQRGAELSVEIDPVVTRQEHLRVLRELGFNRLSIGVQDFDDEVQRIIGRNQWHSVTIGCFEDAREMGFESINLDLMYGLPGQTPEGLAVAAEQVVELGADRVAVFGYAHVPWMKPHQRRLEPFGLPDGPTRWAMAQSVREVLEDAGYAPIGMDHFAKPDDELVVASREGRLGRNFQGYSVLDVEAVDLVALGMSGISDVGGVYLQNQKRVSAYRMAVTNGDFATVRAYERSEGDELRRFVINRIMCNLQLNFDEVRSRFGVDPAEHFAAALEGLAPLVDDGLVRFEAPGLRVTERGRPLLRNVAVFFDAHINAGADDQRRHARAV